MNKYEKGATELIETAEGHLKAWEHGTVGTSLWVAIALVSALCLHLADIASAIRERKE